MFHTRLKLREPKGLITPKGPSFAFARTYQSNLHGTTIKFKAPKHRPKYSNSKPIIPEANSEYLPFRKYYNEQDREAGRIDHWREADFFLHKWAFNGPMFTGTLSELRMNFVLREIVNYPKGISLFHPRTFEQVIGDHLTYYYGYHFTEYQNNAPSYIAPLDWHPLTHLSVHAARLNVQPQDFNPERSVYRWFYFPIKDNVFATIRFTPSRFINRPREELDKRVNEQPMLDLIDDIIHSFEVTLSAEAQAQQKAATAGLEDRSLITHFPPLKWVKNATPDAPVPLVECDE